MKTPTVEELLKVAEAKNYKVFEGTGVDLNIWGIRASTNVPKAFDDLIVAFWKEGKEWVLKAWKATTDPGLYWLKAPMQVRGTAILAPGQYLRVFRRGYHRGYPALQQAGTFRLIRDANRDGKLDFDAKDITSNGPEAGINLHRANERVPSIQVDAWSAGCQVIASPKDFDELMRLVNQSAKSHGEFFSYTLITEADLKAAAEAPDKGKKGGKGE